MIFHKFCNQTLGLGAVLTLLLCIGPPAAAQNKSKIATCGAIAFTAQGAWGISFSARNCDVATQIAVEACKKKASRKDREKCDESPIARVNHWFYVQFCENDKRGAMLVSVNEFLDPAIDSARELAAKRGFKIFECEIRQVFHSNGEHITK